MGLQFVNTRTIATVAALAALTLGVSGCAGSAGADDHADPVPNVSAMPAPSLEDMKAGADAYMVVASDVYGTAIDRWQAGRVLVYKMEAAFTACMAGHGFTHAPMDYSAAPMGQISPADGYDEFTELKGEFGIAAVHRASAELEGAYTDPGFDGLSAAEQGKWADLVAGDCAAPWEPGLENTHIPASLHDVSEALRVAVLEPVHNDPVVTKMRGGYTACVAGLGYAASDWASLRTAAAGAFAASAEGTPTLAVLDADPVWRAAVEGERSAAEADIACRGDMFSYATGLAFPALKTFAETHAADLERLAGEWATMRDEYTSIFG